MRRAVAALTLTFAVTLAGTPAAAAAAPAPPDAQSEQRAVILIPGYGNRIDGPTGTLLETSLINAGYTVIPANVDNMTGDITANAHRVLQQGHLLRDVGYDRVDIVGLSAGGLVARTAVTIDYASHDRTFGTVVAIASPLNGSDLADLGPGWNCDNPTCLQMHPDSAFMRNLPPLPVGKGSVPFYSLWTQDDLVVAPAESMLTGARTYHIQTACPGVVNVWTGHEHLMTSPAFADLTLHALTGQPTSTSVYRCSLGNQP